jgi:hypothetical protein
MAMRLQDTRSWFLPRHFCYQMQTLLITLSGLPTISNSNFKILNPLPQKIEVVNDLIFSSQTVQRGSSILIEINF